MRVQCSYCDFLYDLKEPFDDDSISHGICEECFPIVIKNLESEMEAQNGILSSGAEERSFLGKI